MLQNKNPFVLGWNWGWLLSLGLVSGAGRASATACLRLRVSPKCDSGGKGEGDLYCSWLIAGQGLVDFTGQKDRRLKVQTRLLKRIDLWNGLMAPYLVIFYIIYALG